MRAKQIPQEMTVQRVDRSPMNPTPILQGASHDQIWSVGLKEICEAGLTEEDAQSLASLNWMEEDDALSCFV